MIRLTEIKLPLAHSDTAIADAVVRTLGIQANELQSVHLFKRSFDARKADLLQVYIVDVTLVAPELETAVLLRHADNPHPPFGPPAPHRGRHARTAAGFP